ncbi:AAA family ATPase [Vibrio mytili]|uniref:ATPase AAA n=1 Tax=Vibrio mytili TaxID=50718 RepID=A0A0C3ECS6_9VIBR|nr:ATPase AAA [Vibrio mytili]KIN12233.1 ATPase AAA [Vibrio mytili]
MSKNIASTGKTVILVNGVPASGKSSVACNIARYFNITYLSIDTIKEPFMATVENYNRTINRELGKAAYQVIWDIIKQAPQNHIFVVDAWFGFQPKESLIHYLYEAQVDTVIEVWNQISGTTVAKRYEERIPHRSDKHPKHEYLPELAALADRAEPMSIGSVIRLEQDKCLDMEWLYSRISELLSTPEKKTA